MISTTGKGHIRFLRGHSISVGGKKTRRRVKGNIVFQMVLNMRVILWTICMMGRVLGQIRLVTSIGDSGFLIKETEMGQ